MLLLAYSGNGVWGMEAHEAAIELGTGVKVLTERLWGPGYLQPWRVAAQTHDGTRVAASGQEDAAAYMWLMLLFDDS